MEGRLMATAPSGSAVPVAGPDKTPRRIAGMFDAIARRYDLLNHLLSGGLDLYWRARAVRELGFSGREVLVDVCTGTCDVMLSALKQRARGPRYAIGLDFADAMLRVGQRKVADRGLAGVAPLLRGDAMQLPLATATADAATIAFGIRNVYDPQTALADLHRILKPGGRLAILEFAMPQAPLLRALYGWYFRAILPRIGRMLSKHNDAYTYLPESVGTFYRPDEFGAMLGRAGFSRVRAVPLTFGVVYLYVAHA
jgi:demethylmenaquinone methyltransferase/2-methoxy-6-polyprenyl-1,4-benzoquinol methylase